MLEILLLIFLSKKIGNMALAKGYSKGLFVALTVIFWVAFELVGAIVGILALGENSLGTYLCALLGAGCGYLIIYTITNILQDNTKDQTVEESPSLDNGNTL